MVWAHWHNHLVAKVLGWLCATWPIPLHLLLNQVFSKFPGHGGSFYLDGHHLSMVHLTCGSLRASRQQSLEPWCLNFFDVPPMMIQQEDPFYPDWDRTVPVPYALLAEVVGLRLVLPSFWVFSTTMTLSSSANWLVSFWQQRKKVIIWDVCT